MYERRGYSPERAAVAILRAVGRNRAIAPIGPDAHFAYALTRVARPWRAGFPPAPQPPWPE